MYKCAWSHAPMYGRGDITPLNITISTTVSVVSTYNTLLVISSSFTPLPRHDRIACTTTHIFIRCLPRPQPSRRVFLYGVWRIGFFSLPSRSSIVGSLTLACQPRIYRCGKNTKRIYIVYKRRQKNKTKNPIHTYINTVLTTLWGRKSLRTRPRRIVYYATATRITI